MPVGVSRETEDRLRHYEALVHKWQKAINLVGPKTLDGLWQRHIIDSLQLLPIIRDDAKTLFDFGSGAGFPGMVLAIARSDVNVTLVESDQRKCSFLQAVSRETKTPVQIKNMRIEQLGTEEKPDVITARALAPLDDLLRLSMSFAQYNHRLQLVFPKGAQAAAELEKARKSYDFEHVSFPSETGADACILSLTALCVKTT